MKNITYILLVVFVGLSGQVLGQTKLPFYEEFDAADWSDGDRINTHGNWNGTSNAKISDEQNNSWNGTRCLKFESTNANSGWNTQSADLLLDLSGESNVRLEFDVRWRDGNNADHTEDSVFFSNDGGSTWS